MGSGVSLFRHGKVTPSPTQRERRARRQSVQSLGGLHPDGGRRSMSVNKRAAQRRSSTTWKAPPNITKIRRESNAFQSDPLLLELRLCLDDPMGQKHLGNFAKKIGKGSTEALFCWVDIQEYRSIPKSDYRRHFAVYIFEKYVKDNAKMKVQSVTPELIKEVKDKIEAAKEDPKSLEDSLFENVQLNCLTEIKRTTYMEFKASEDYDKYQKEMKDTYNKVVVDDFEYMDILGLGGYARVFHVRKISTGRHYAMKVQLKSKIVEENINYPENMVSERKLLAMCHHPYLIDLFYAFQTDKYIIMVLELMQAGDLAGEVSQEVERTLYGLSEERTQLYIAEIAMVLSHLHNMGIIYRDLKPCNVLLGGDGHIKLADMGFAKRTTAISEEIYDPWSYPNIPSSSKKLLVMETKPRSSIASLVPQMPSDGSGPTLEGPSQPRDSITGENANEGANNLGATGQVSPGTSTTPTTPKPLVRAKSTVGTRGYLAPEIIKGRLHSRSKRKPYTEAVDFWALGVSCYELLTGTMPFHNLEISQVFDAQDGKGKNNLKDAVNHAIKQMSQEIQFPANISPTAQDFIRCLLHVDPEKRLGFDGIRKHPFMANLDWDKLAMRHVVATTKPRVKNLPEKPKYSSFQAAMSAFDSIDKKIDWNAEFNPEHQHYFLEWDFVSPQTLKIELGIAVQLDASNVPYKICQLTGETPIDD